MKNDCFRSCRPYLSAPIPNVSFFGIPPRSCTPYRMNLQRLKGTLDAFNYGFTVDEIGELIQELDEDGQGSVGEEEFCHLLHKYEEFLKPHKRRELSPY